MQNSGESEQSSSQRALTLGTLPSLLITLAGGTGLISLVVGGPSWLTWVSFGLTLTTVAVVAVQLIAQRRRG